MILASFVHLRWSQYLIFLFFVLSAAAVVVSQMVLSLTHYRSAIVIVAVVVVEHQVQGSLSGSCARVYMFQSYILTYVWPKISITFV